MIVANIIADVICYLCGPVKSTCWKAARSSAPASSGSAKDVQRAGGGGLHRLQPAGKGRVGLPGGQAGGVRRHKREKVCTDFLRMNAASFKALPI